MNDRRTSRLALATLVFALGAIGQDALAANKFVRQGATGAGTGNNWTDAYASTAAITWTSGNTYFFAGGTYSPFSVGANSVTIKRATATAPACTGAAGWSAGYDAQVVMNQTTENGIYVGPRDGVTIDGVVIDGIRINPTTSLPVQNAAITTYGNNTTIRRVKVQGNNQYSVWTAAVKMGKSEFGLKTNIFISECEFSNLSQLIFQGYPADYITIEKSKLHTCLGSGGLHNNVFYTDGPQHVIFRWNEVYNWSAVGVSVGTLGRPTDHWQIYGNRFGPGHLAGGSDGDGVSIIISGRAPPLDLNSIGPNITIVNNTFVRGDHADIRVVFNGQVTGGTIKNNVSYDGDGGNGQWSLGTAPFTRDYNWFSFANAYTAGEPNSIVIGNTNTVPFLDIDARDYHIPTTISSTMPRNKGTALDVVYSLDPDGNTRGADGTWDMGAYEFTAEDPGNPGTFNLSSSSYTVGEGDGTVTITVTRSGGSTGAVDVPYATSNGTAVSTNDYNAVSSTLSWASGDTADKTFTVTIHNDASVEGSETFTVALSSPTGGGALGSTSSATVTIQDNDSVTVPSLSYPTWQAEDMLVESPFVATSTNVSQSVLTTDPAAGGRLRAKITIPDTGYYKLKSSINAPDSGANSAFVDWDQEPTSPTTIWDVQSLTTGFEDRYVSWRGNGTFDAPQFATNRWFLSAGERTIYVRGREAGMILNSFTLEVDTFEQEVAFDPQPQIVLENGGSVALTVLRFVDTTGTVTVNFATQDGTALAGTHYESASGTLTFTNGVTSRQIAVNITDNAAYGGNKSFAVALSSPSGCTIGTPGDSTVTIFDNESPGTKLKNAKIKNARVR
jgi:hypothetical protein